MQNLNYYTTEKDSKLVRTLKKIIRNRLTYFLLFVATCGVIINLQLQRTKSLKQSLSYRDSLFTDMYYSVIDSNEKTAFVVTATVYSPTVNQCDKDPQLTSCMKKIDLSNPGRHRYVALSRDLLKEFYYGEKVIIENTHSKYDGEYIVADCMNKRFIRSVDILVGRSTMGMKIKNVIIRHK